MRIGILTLVGPHLVRRALIVSRLRRWRRVGVPRAARRHSAHTAAGTILGERWAQLGTSEILYVFYYIPDRIFYIAHIQHPKTNNYYFTEMLTF